MPIKSVLAACAMVVACGCSGPDSSEIDPGQLKQPIIGGTLDNGDPAVAIIFLESDGGDPWADCTGVLIAPRVLATAAHCMDNNVADPSKPEDPATNPRLTKHQVAFATAFDWQSGNFTGLKEFHEVAYAKVHPGWNGDPGNGSDIALLQLDQKSAIAPAAINRTPLTNSVIGKPVRMAGWGVTSEMDNSTTSEKRQTSSTIADWYSSPPVLEVADSVHTTCYGDSGGPQFLTINNVEVVAGLTSFNQGGCLSSSFSTRVDAYLPFIDGFVQTYNVDPPPKCVSDGMCEADCGTTDPDCPKPPSCAGGDSCVPGCTPHDPDCPLLGVGASCVVDTDCATGYCDPTSVCATTCEAAGSTCPDGYACVAAGNHAICEALPPQKPKPNPVFIPSAKPAIGSAATGCSAAPGGSASAGTGWATTLIGLVLLTLSRRKRPDEH